MHIYVLIGIERSRDSSRTCWLHLGNEVARPFLLCSAIGDEPSWWESANGWSRLSLRPDRCISTNWTIPCAVVGRKKTLFLVKSALTQI